MKLKKILMAFLVLSATLLLTACVKTHTHTFADEWSKDAKNHWHAATCEHTTEVSDKAAHAWNEGVVTTEATVDAEGVKTFTCTVCGQTKTEAINKLEPETGTQEHEHTFSDEWTSDENDHWHAATCEHTTEVSGKDAHAWDEGQVTTQPTVDAEGVKTFTCTVCEATKTEPVDALTQEHEHTFSDEWTSDENDHWHAATCEHTTEVSDKDAHTGGEATETAQAVCEVCGASYGELAQPTPTPEANMVTVYFQNNWKWTDVKIHLWNDNNVAYAEWPGTNMVVAGTCTAYGGEVINFYSFEFDANIYTNFQFNGMDSGKGATNQTPDLKVADYIDYFATDLFYIDWDGTNECNVIGHFAMSTDSGLHLHSYSDEWSSDANNHWHACSCNLKKDEDAHSWDEGVETTAPTEDAAGVKTYTCSVCEATKTESIPALGHTHSHSTEWSSDNSNHWHECACGDKVDEDAHTGGEATYEEKAVCEVCGTSYGELLQRNMVTVYFQNNWLWSNIHIYLWGGEGAEKAELATWPGTAMELVGSFDNQELYALEFDADIYTSFIINGIKNDGSNATDQTPDLLVADHAAYLATDCFYMLWDGTNNCNTYGHCQMSEDALHIHKYSEWSKDETKHWHECSCSVKKDEADHSADAWSKDETNHWHECVCGYKYDEAAHSVAETKYENGYKVELCACGNEQSKVAYLTYVVSNTNDKSKNVTGHFELAEDVYSSTLTLAAWDFVVLYYDGNAISSSAVTMLPGTAWNGGGWAGVVYPFYHDGDATGVEASTGFVSPTGGEYKVAYNHEENTLLLGDSVAENVVSVISTEADSAFTVWAAGTEIRKQDGTYPNNPGTWGAFRLFVIVDSQGRIAYMCLFIPKGYGNPLDASYTRHSAYANYKDNPAFSYLSDEYTASWGGTTVDWALTVPEGGFGITAHGDSATALVRLILNDNSLVATDDYEERIGSTSHNVDNIRLVYNATDAVVEVNTAE